MHEPTRRWFERRTYRHGDFSPDALTDAKAASPVPTRVSVVLPALDEEATVGRIVETIRADLVVATPLLDEVLVVDSGSADATARVAADAGARVVAASEIMPHLGTVPGKGEALWKGLLAAKGDLVAFVDADIVDFGSHFVTGLLGPLLTDPSVHYVKGFYDRPLASDTAVHPSGGGRVTELVARPLLNLYYPELAGFVQPLAGEYAARRSALEAVPFVAGYGVETAMLIDLLAVVGLDAMAQVDLGVRTHKHQSDAALGVMAAQILATALARIAARDGCPDPMADPSAASLTQFVRRGAEHELVCRPITLGERPPVASLPHPRTLLDARPPRRTAVR